MKDQNRIRLNGSAKPAAQQAKIRTPGAPAEFKTIRLRECPMADPGVKTPQELVAFWREHVTTAPWFNGDKECLCVFFLNARHRLTGFELVSQGTLDTILMHPREVLRPAAVHSAAAIIIAHNHPSGDPAPSEADIKVTRELIRAAAILKIELLDHVIIGDARRNNSFASLRGLGYFDDNPSEAAPAENGSLAVAVPQSLALDVKDSLARLKREGTAAAALCVLNAHSIRNGVHDGLNGMGKIGGPAFPGGIVELAEAAETEFDGCFRSWQADQLAALSGKKHSTEAWVKMGNAVISLFHLLRLQGELLTNHHPTDIPDLPDSGGTECSLGAIDRLASAWTESHQHSGQVRQIIEAEAPASPLKQAPPVVRLEIPAEVFNRAIRKCKWDEEFSPDREDRHFIISPSKELKLSGSETENALVNMVTALLPGAVSEFEEPDAAVCPAPVG